MCSTGAHWFADFDPYFRKNWSALYGAAGHRLHFRLVKQIRARGSTALAGSEFKIMAFSCAHERRGERPELKRASWREPGLAPPGSPSRSG